MHEPDTKCYEGVPIENSKKFVERFEGTNTRISTKKAWLISLKAVSSQKCERLN